MSLVSQIASFVTRVATEFNSLRSEVTSALSGKADSVHGHAISDVTNLQTTLDGKASTSHGHAISDVTDLQNQLNAKANLSGATFSGLLTANGTIATTEIRTSNGQQLILAAGEATSYDTGLTGELVYNIAEGGIYVAASPDNWGTGWAGRRETIIGANGAYTQYALPTGRTWRPTYISTGNPSGGVDGDVWLKYS